MIALVLAYLSLTLELGANRSLRIKRRVKSLEKVVRHYFFYFILFALLLRPHDALKILLSGPKNTERIVKMFSFQPCLNTKKKRNSTDLLNDHLTVRKRNINLTSANE